jgi:predicted dienelactone hydrolase
MKQLRHSLKYPAAAALVALAMGCATGNNALSNDNLAIAAGFKVITPLKPDQQALLAKLPKDKVSPVTYQGTTYYVLPDSMNNLAYVGGLPQYQDYQRMRVAKQLSNNNLEAAQMNEMNAMDWGGWGGWGGPAFVGFRR